MNCGPGSPAVRMQGSEPFIFRRRRLAGEKGRVEHLKRHSGGCHADARQLANLPGPAAGGDHAKRLLEVAGHARKTHTPASPTGSHFPDYLACKFRRHLAYRACGGSPPATAVRWRDRRIKGRRAASAPPDTPRRASRAPRSSRSDSASLPTRTRSHRLRTDS